MWLPCSTGFLDAMLLALASSAESDPCLPGIRHADSMISPAPCHTAHLCPNLQDALEKERKAAEDKERRAKQREQQKEEQQRQKTQQAADACAAAAEARAAKSQAAVTDLVTPQKPGHAVCPAPAMPCWVLGPLGAIKVASLSSWQLQACHVHQVPASYPCRVAVCDQVHQGTRALLSHRCTAILGMPSGRSSCRCRQSLTPRSASHPHRVMGSSWILTTSPSPHSPSQPPPCCSPPGPLPSPWCPTTPPLPRPGLAAAAPQSTSGRGAPSGNPSAGPCQNALRMTPTSPWTTCLLARPSAARPSALEQASAPASRHACQPTAPALPPPCQICQPPLSVVWGQRQLMAAAAGQLGLLGAAQVRADILEIDCGRWLGMLMEVPLVMAACEKTPSIAHTCQ